MKSVARPKRSPETAIGGRLSRLKLTATGVAPQSAAVNRTSMIEVVVKGWEGGFSGLQSAEPSFMEAVGVGRGETGIVINRGPAGQTNSAPGPGERQ